MRYQFEREMEFLAALHPYHGFPKVLGCGWEGAVPWLQLTDCGQQVANVIKAGLVTVELAWLQYAALIQVMEGLGIKHRDLSVGNLMWHPERGCHIVDFGIAIWSEREEDVAPAYLWMGGWSCGEGGMSDEDRLRWSFHEMLTGEKYDKPDWEAGKRGYEYAGSVPE